MPASLDDLPGFARGPYGLPGSIRASNMEPLRPIEPTSTHSIPRPYLPMRVTEGEPGQQRQQLPGVQELLTPSARPETRSPFGSWLPINNSSSHWQDTTPRHASIAYLPQSKPGSYTPLQPSIHQSHPNGASAETYRSPAHRSSFAAASTPRPSLPIPPMTQIDVADPRQRDQVRRASQYGDPFSASLLAPHVFGSLSDQRQDATLERRSSLATVGRPSISAAPYGSQCVGQRNIPGEGLCFVFKDGSTCPTIIDGEPVNPLWGTTKAGKARKRLAQACL